MALREVDDRVMDASARASYTADRKLHPDPARSEEQLETLQNVVICNGALYSEIRDALSRDFEEYKPLKSDEIHFWNPRTGTLYAHNARGTIRLLRDVEQAKVLSEMTGRDLAINLQHYRDSPTDAGNRFTKFAHLNVKKIMEVLPRDEVRENGRLFALIGPHDSVPADRVTLLETLDHEYLNVRVLTIGDNVVVNWDYIFSDQADRILRQFYLSCDAALPGVELHVVHYGRVGALSPFVHVGDLCIPVNAYEEEGLSNDSRQKYPLQNTLITNPDIGRRLDDILRTTGPTRLFSGNTVNTTSVLNQTRTQLLAAQRVASFLEMEWLHIGLVLKDNYPNIKSISRYFAGVASDEPLAGKTLGDTPSPKAEERRLAEGLVELIRGL